jgi:aldose 1-epimerase
MTSIPGPPITDRIALRCGQHEAWIAPAIGGSIARFVSHTPTGTVDWLRPASERAWADGAARGMGSFPLIPWSNRMRQARTDFGGRPIRPMADPRSAPHASHGLAWQVPWQVVSPNPAVAKPQHGLLSQVHHGARNSVESVTLAWRHEPDGAWPYAFECRQHYALSAGGCLCIDMSLTNRDTAPMPAGIGHHAYFPDAASAVLQTEVQGIWTVDAEKMPVAWEPAALAPSLALGIAVAELDLDHHFTGWSRCARLSWPGRGVALDIRGTSPLDMVVLYTPAHREFFCVEPVSHLADWMNLASAGTSRVGGHVLEPGRALQARIELQPVLG